MFDGWFLKIGDTMFPMEYITASTYKIWPDQRQDVDSIIDSNGELHRNVAEHTRSKIEFMMPPVNDKDLARIWAIYEANWIIEIERKLRITYYHPESTTYKTGYFYLPNLEYPINTASLSANTIEYGPIRYAFTEY